MPSGPLEIKPQLPVLKPLTEINRPVSGSEYYHASTGTSRNTLEVQRKVIFSFQADFDDRLSEEDWTYAIRQVAIANPALRMRWKGVLGWSRWMSDGPLPPLRVLHVDHFDYTSGIDFERICSKPFNLRKGPLAEFLLIHINRKRTIFVMHTAHAVMDGMGSLHCLQDIFRVLRGMKPHGSNCNFSDHDLARALQPTKGGKMHEPTCTLTGGVRLDQPLSTLKKGAALDVWRRIHLGPVRSKLMALLAEKLVQFAHRHSQQTALVAVPVDLRRHHPGLLTLTNFSSMVIVKLKPGEGRDNFRQALIDNLESHRELAAPANLEFLKWIPLRLLDRLMGRTHKNLLSKKPMETVLITNLGAIYLENFSAPGFKADDMSVCPVPGNSFCTLFSVDGEAFLNVSLPLTQASEGRHQALIDYLLNEFKPEKQSEGFALH